MGSKRENILKNVLGMDLINIAKKKIGESNFSKNKLDNNYFHVISNENEEQILAFRAGCYIKNFLIRVFV